MNRNTEWTILASTTTEIKKRKRPRLRLESWDTSAKPVPPFWRLAKNPTGLCLLRDPFSGHFQKTFLPGQNQEIPPRAGSFYSSRSPGGSRTVLLMSATSEDIATALIVSDN